jgi:hypothetical protein
MPSTARAQLLRQRFKTLFPHAAHPIPPRPKKAVHGQRAAKRVYTWAFFNYEDTALPRDARWLGSPERKPEQAAVAPERRRKGQAALTVIAEKLKRGAAVWPKYGT